MRINVIDGSGRNIRALESPLHRLSRPYSRRLRLRDAEVICGNTVTHDFRQNRRAALAGEARGFPGPKLRRLHRAPYRNDGDQMDCIFPALKLEANQSPGMPSRPAHPVCPLIPVGNDRTPHPTRARPHLSRKRRHWCITPKTVCAVDHRLLRRVIRNPCRRMPQIPGSAE